MISDFDFGLFNGSDLLRPLFSVKLVTEAVLQTTDAPQELEMILQRSRVLNTPVPLLDKVVFPSKAFFSTIAALTGVSKSSGGAPSPTLQTLYASQRLRVNRLVRSTDG